MTADLEKVAVNPSPHVVTGLQFIDIVQNGWQSAWIET